MNTAAYFARLQEAADRILSTREPEIDLTQPTCPLCGAHLAEPDLPVNEGADA